MKKQNYWAKKTKCPKCGKEGNPFYGGLCPDCAKSKNIEQQSLKENAKKQTIKLNESKLKNIIRNVIKESLGEFPEEREEQIASDWNDIDNTSKGKSKYSSSDFDDFNMNLHYGNKSMDSKWCENYGTCSMDALKDDSKYGKSDHWKSKKGDCTGRDYDLIKLSNNIQESKLNKAIKESINKVLKEAKYGRGFTQKDYKDGYMSREQNPYSSDTAIMLANRLEKRLGNGYNVTTYSNDYATKGRKEIEFLVKNKNERHPSFEGLMYLSNVCKKMFGDKITVDAKDGGYIIKLNATETLKNEPRRNMLPTQAKGKNIVDPSTDFSVYHKGVKID